MELRDQEPLQNRVWSHGIWVVDQKCKSWFYKKNYDFIRRPRVSTHTSGDDKVVLWSANNFSSLYPGGKYPPDRFVQSKSRFGIRNLPKIGLEYRGWIREQPIKSKKNKSSIFLMSGLYCTRTGSVIILLSLLTSKTNFHHTRCSISDQDRGGGSELKF